MSKGLRHNVQQTRSTEAIEERETPAVCSPAEPFTRKSKLHRCYRDLKEGMISCLLTASVHPLIIIPILKPAVSLERFEEDTAVSYFYLAGPPGYNKQTTIQSSERARRSPLGAAKCDTGVPHGAQALHPEADGKRQSISSHISES